MVKWESVRIPASLMQEVEEYVRSSNLYISKSEFIRDAIRKKLMEETSRM